MLFMMFAARTAKRFAVFIPGIIIIYVSFRYTLPFLDKRLPDLVALGVAYLLGVYVLVPLLFRLYRIVSPPNHLPLYCITPDGFASDPLNIGVICTRRQLITAMQKASWHMSDPHTPRNILHHIFCLVLGIEYATAPLSNLYLFGRKQDLAFQVPVNRTNVKRHHVRFWATTYKQANPLSAEGIHWYREQPGSEGPLLWVGAASLDIGIIPIKHNLQLTHMVHPDTNQERELIVAQLKKLGLVRRQQNVKLDNPYSLVNRTWRGELHTDGLMTVVWLN